MHARTESNVRDDALDTLRAFISDGDYRPGSRLPPERELIDDLGMSRSTLRRALDTLEREGAIWRHVGKGTFVAADDGDSAHGSLAELNRLVTPVQLMRARSALEPAICREAAINASSAAVARIRLARDRAQTETSWEEYEARDDQFHRAVAEATGNVLLLSLFDHLNEVRRAVAWNSVVRQTARPPADHPSFAEHARITEAVEARNPVTAFDAMREHLRSVASRLFGEA